MSQKPIAFNRWAVQRILAGEKTATMRPLKRRPPDDTDRAAIRDGAVSFYRAGVHYLDYDQRAPYQVGDILWPREPWRVGSWHDDDSPVKLADDVPLWYEANRDLYSLHAKSQMGRLRPAMYLPKRFSRPNRYKVLRVEVRRPQNLTRAEIIAEGIRYPYAEVGKPMEAPEGWYRNAWYNLWLKIYGIRSWVGNDWCWRTTFKELI